MLLVASAQSQEVNSRKSSIDKRAADASDVAVERVPLCLDERCFCQVISKLAIGPYDDDIFGMQWVYVEWMNLCSITPVFGAVLLVLGIEVTRAISEIKELRTAAENKSLARAMYISARDRIHDRYSSWGVSLGTLAIAALCNLIGLVFILHNNYLDPYFHYKIWQDLYHIVLMGSEGGLSFAVLGLTATVNGHADAITSVLNMETWGDPGSKEEGVRLDLINLTTIYSIKPEVADKIWKRLYTPKNRPISFKIFGIRPTGDLFVAAILSLVGSVGGALVQSLIANDIRQ